MMQTIQIDAASVLCHINQSEGVVTFKKQEEIFIYRESYLTINISFRLWFLNSSDYSLLYWKSDILYCSTLFLSL
jgi:hypothetical protein